MKPKKQKPTAAGFTLIEMLAVIVVLLILSVLLWPARTGRGSTGRVQCLWHQRQINLAFRALANDNDNQFPWELKTNQGVLETYQASDAAADFKMLQGYSIPPNFLVCPSDHGRTPAVNIASLQNVNLSYFMGIDCRTNVAGGDSDR